MDTDIGSESAGDGGNNGEKRLQQKKLSWNKLRRYDSLELESGKVAANGAASIKGAGARESWAVVLKLAFQSIGVVYGDIGTSPLYVLAGTFTGEIQNKDDIIAVLSIILYTITLIPLIKYVFIVLRANDNGEGGTFALYSLLCRHARVGLIPSQQAEDRDVSTFRLELPNSGARTACRVKSALENSNFAKHFMLFATMLGTAMVIGDGILTPCISVLSAVGGIKEAAPSMNDATIVWISVAILIFLFSFQRFGTDKVGYTFAPILCVWFAFISGIGIYNFFKYDPTVIKALNPKYIVDYFKRNKKEAWISLGGTVLSITGAEALFADVGHFSVNSIQLSTCTVIYPALMVAYAGQGAYLRKHTDVASDIFYKSIPGPMYWPMFVVAVLAAVIASQALISGTFSIVQQSLALGCFPRVKIVHTSPKHPGQVYIPEVNYLLMLACIFVTLGYKTTDQIGHAYGIAVVFVMTLTSAFLVLVMLVIWKTHIVLVIGFVLVFGTVELVYLSSVLYKFNEGGYLPLAFAAVIMTVTFVWNHVYRRRYYYELEHKISPETAMEIIQETKSTRLPGLAIFYSELAHGIPPLFRHYVENVPALHSVLVFVSFKSLPISKVPEEERFLLRRVQPRDLNLYRCVVRYGYNDARGIKEDSFEKLLVDRLRQFIVEDGYIGQAREQRGNEDEACIEEVDNDTEVARDVEDLENAWRSGVVHLVGDHEVMARKGSGLGKRVLIDYAYNFLKRNVRQSKEVYDIPHRRMLKVGMIYEL
ncbi:potassium transporter 5-like [Andrographis paniculata]|uniref:potassium transporter 5-like n=1 Tax=Andrographis paniculata TaxID=175694 RepID=UPI0021E85837|nr:potassium transporter 5-like [Andrographis paniculata]